MRGARGEEGGQAAPDNQAVPGNRAAPDNQAALDKQAVPDNEAAPGTRSTTAIRPLLRQLAQRCREGRAALGNKIWTAWLRRIAIAVVAMFGLMVVLRYAADWALQAGLLDRERDFLLWLGSFAPLPFSAAVFIQTFGSDITLIILLAFTAGIAAWMRRPIISLSILLAAVVPDIVGRFGWAIWSRARPDLLYDGIASPGFHSFPSGHTSKTIAVYGLLTVLWIRASRSPVEKLIAVLLLCGIVVVVPLGRMAMGVHWPSDVIGGLVIGGVWLGVLAWCLPDPPDRPDPPDLDS